ncbi:TPA: hypothetical protein DDW35_05405 [Candidatus Sumerlaeota bacterium]|jgi:hypothetical protein|nr:hypothetical protein [Candidatus Sumerlaeota bacterium]
MFFIFAICCTFFMFTYALSPQRTPWTRIASLLMIPIMWFVPYCWWIGLLWGALCWGDSRAGGH